MSNKGGPGSKSADVSRYIKIHHAREKAEKQTPAVAPRAGAFLEPNEHRAVTAAMFAELLLTPASEVAVALEFFRAYRHLFEGGALTDLPVQLINRSSLIARVKASLRGKPLLEG